MFIYEGKAKDFIKFLYEETEKGNNVLFSSAKNTPQGRNVRPRIYYRDGQVATFSSWTQFMYVLQDKAKNKVDVNIPKTQKYLSDNFEYESNMKIVCNYTSNEYANTIDKSEKDGIIVPENVGKVDIYLVVKKSKELKAGEFKEWLEEYLLTFPTNTYKVDNTKGVAKLIRELEETL